MKILVKLQNWPKRGDSTITFRSAGRVWDATWNDKANAYVFKTDTIDEVNQCLSTVKAAHIQLGIYVEEDVIESVKVEPEVPEIEKPPVDDDYVPDGCEKFGEKPVEPAEKPKKHHRRRG